MIYIVEDDAAIRELEQYALQSSGYQVNSFPSSEPFWQAMRTTEPELVILDVMLPDEDGFSILKKLRNTPSLRRLPIIMVTAKSSELDTVRGLDCGADDYILSLIHIWQTTALPPVRSGPARSAAPAPLHQNTWQSRQSHRPPREHSNPFAGCAARFLPAPGTQNSYCFKMCIRDRVQTDQSDDIFQVLRLQTHQDLFHARRFELEYTLRLTPGEHLVGLRVIIIQLCDCERWILFRCV